MSPVAFVRVLCALVLLSIPLTHTVDAAEAIAITNYAIELDVPAAQRPLLENNLDLYRWRGSERTTDAQLKRLVKLAPAQIAELLSTEGFYSPRIDAQLKQEGGQWMVSLTVDPGAPTKVTSIDLQVEGPFDDGSPTSRERLLKMRKDWTLPPGAVFRQSEWESAKRNALKALLLEDYPNASLADSVAEVDPETHGVKLKVSLNSGPAVSFGALEINGLKRYPPSVVEHINPITPGEPYSQAKLLELQSRLQDSPYFSGVGVSIENDATQPNEVPIQVDVTEQSSRKLGFGIGVSTDSGVRGQVDYRDLNVFDRAWVLGSALKLDHKTQFLSGDIQLPPTGAKYRDSLNALAERTDIEGQETRKLVLGAKRRVVEADRETVYSLRYWDERQYIGNEAAQSNFALSLSYNWTRRQVDNLLFPTRGYVINLQADGALRALLSSQDFVRGFGHVALFYPISPRDQLILRGQLGMVAAKSRDGIPTDFLFRTGGDQTVRGYAFQSLGVEDNSAIVGGRYLAVASVEAVHWLSDKWGAAAFIDHGNATDSLRNLKLVTGYGAGVRWKSPVGPLNLDVAYGQETKKFRLHFSVGFSF